MRNIITVCVFVFINRHTKGIFLYRIVLDNVLSVNFLVRGTSVEKKKRSLPWNVNFVFLSAFIRHFFIWRRTYLNLHLQRLKFLLDFTQTWIFSTGFNRNPRYKIPRMSFRWEASCFMVMDVWRDTQTTIYNEVDYLFPQIANAQNRSESFPMFKTAVFKIV
jgi:hypothetical protein